MPGVVVECGQRKNLTATGTIAGSGELMGVFVSQNTSSTLQVADANGNIANTFTPIAGTYYPMPCGFTGGLTVTLSGTMDCTVFYSPG